MPDQPFQIKKKRVVYHVIQELVNRNYDVYISVSKESEFNCIIVLDQYKHVDIRIDAHSDKTENWTLFPNITCEPRNDYYFMFYTEPDDKYYIIPSEDLPKMAKPLSNGNYDFDISEIGVKILASYTDANGFKILEKLRFEL